VPGTVAQECLQADEQALIFFSSIRETPKVRT